MAVDRGRFDFDDEWRVAAAPDAVWAVIRDVEAWPQWWPAVRSVTRMVPTGGGASGAGATWEFRFRTRLPYDISYAAEVVREEPHVSVQTRVVGRLDGRGGWRVEPVEGGTLVHFDWWVRPRPRWMRVVAPLARPVFGWNHRSLMAEGAYGLAGRLGTELLAPPVATLRPAA